MHWDIKCGESGEDVCGHALLGYGLSGTIVSYMDPWPSNKRTDVHDYSWVKQASDHMWTQTVLMNVKGITFVIDDTGSMWDNIDEAKAAAIKVVDDNTAAGRHFLYTLMTFKDGDGVLRGQTLDPDEVESLINSLYAYGGNDCPESSLTAARQAAALLPNSEIYLMTDADSNSYGVDGTYASVGEVLYTAYVLAANSVTMNAIIYGDCSSSSSATAGSHPFRQPGCNGVRNMKPKELSSSRKELSSSTIDSGVGGFEYLSQVSGGLFFNIGVTDTSTATDMILRHASSDATVAVYDGNAPATYDIPVDSTISALQIALNSLSGSGNSLQVDNPSGATVTGGTSGVVVSNLGSNTSYSITSPALTAGKWQVAVGGSGSYRVTVTATTTNPLDYTGGTSVGIGGTLTMQVGLMTGVPHISFGLTTADGSATLPASLYDDGLHADGHADDFFYAGTLPMNTVGAYRFKVTGDGFFQRMYPNLITVGYVDVVAPTPEHVLAGAASSYAFKIKNLGTSQDTYNLYASSSLHWADLSAMPPNVTVPAGGAVEVDIPVNVPASAASGQIDVLSLEAVSQADTLINSTGETRTIAGPDVTPPDVTILMPQPYASLQRTVSLTAKASDDSGVAHVYFYVRQPGGSSGTPIGYEDLPGAQDASGNWVYPFDTTLLPNGNYVVLAKAVDTNSNVAWGSVPVTITNLPAVSLPAPPTFPSELVGATSPAQTVTVTNTGSANLTFTAIGVTGPFAIATSGTTCSTSNPVAAAGSCTVAITFTPTAGGSASGSVTFTDNAADSPQSLALTGTGQDFTLAVASSSSSSQTVSAGATATYTLTATSIGGFDQAVSLTCNGAPSEASCQLSPSSVTPSSAGSNTTVTVTTTAPSITAPRSRHFPPAPPLQPGSSVLALLAVLLAGVAWAARGGQQLRAHRRIAFLALAVGLFLTLGMMACGGGGAGRVTHDPGTPAGTYNLTVKATLTSGSTTLTHNVALTLKVQ